MTTYSVDVTGCQSVIQACRDTMDHSNDHFIELMGAIWAGIQSSVSSITADGGHATSYVDDLGKAEEYLWEEQISPAFQSITGTVRENVDNFEAAVNYFLEGDHLMEMASKTGGRSDDVYTAPEVTQDGEVVHEGGYIEHGSDDPYPGPEGGINPKYTADGPKSPVSSPFAFPED